MLLVIDVGNTNTVLGLYDGQELIRDWRIRTVTDHTVDEYGVLILALYRNGHLDTGRSRRSSSPALSRRCSTSSSRSAGSTSM